MKEKKSTSKSSKKVKVKQPISTSIKKSVTGLKQHPMLTLMLLPGIIFIIVFGYLPMYGIQIAFKDYGMFDTIQSAPWVGFQNFKYVFEDPKFYEVMRNTIILSFGKLITGFPLAIIFAILFNELKIQWFKKTSQTITYIPHFFSWVIFGGMLLTWLSEYGLVNNILTGLHLIDKPIHFMTDLGLYRYIAIFSDIYKEVAWNTILYIAAMTSIDVSLYEAAKVDGASKLRQIWHITLPGIRNIVVLMLILSMGSLIGSNLDQTLVLQNAVNTPVSEVIDSYVLKVGLSNADMSYAAAVSLFTSLVALTLVLTTRYISSKISDESVF